MNTDPNTTYPLLTTTRSEIIKDLNTLKPTPNLKNNDPRITHELLTHHATQLGLILLEETTDRQTHKAITKLCQQTLQTILNTPKPPPKPQLDEHNTQ